MKEVLSNIRRTPFQSMSVFMLQFFGAFLLLVSIASTGFLMSIFNRVEVQIPVIVYFKPTTEEKEIFRIRETILKTQKVGTIEYIDQAKAFEFYKKQNKDNPLLLEMTSAENFPPSLQIQGKKPEYLNEIAIYLNSEKSVDEVQFEKETVDRLITITTILRTSIFVLAIYLAVMTFVTLVTMVMFKIALRKDEIELNQLLGATTSRIANPFYDEGNFITFMSTVFSASVFGALVYAMRDSFNNYLTGVDALKVVIQQFTIQIWPIDPLVVGGLCGAVLVYMLLISALATKVATGKYIR